MAEDPLDKKISVEVALTEHGIEASARSRALAAVDRLCGNAVDFFNIPMERRNQRERAKMEGEKVLLSAVAAEAATRLKADPLMADRAIQNHFSGILRAQENKDGVAREAVEQLKLAPPSSAEDASGAGAISDDFMSRFERHAAEASSDALREKWARVLASEIRKPGTFTSKEMRVVDELTSQTAQLFEVICRSRIGNVIPKILLDKKLEFAPTTALVTADLLVDPGLGQVNYFIDANMDGHRMWLCPLQRYAVGFPYGVEYGKTRVLLTHDGSPTLEVYVLTEVGEAISSILDNTQEAAFRRLVGHLHEKIPTVAFSEYELPNGISGFYSLRRTIPAASPG